MDGSIEIRNGKTEQQRRSTEFSQTLKRWLAMFAETFQRNSSLSEIQASAYLIALSDLSAEQLNLACAHTLRTWSYAAMPPPGFIRQCLKEVSTEGYLGPRAEKYPEISQDERDAALDDPEFQENKKRALNATIRNIAEKKRLPPPTPKRFTYATDERVNELQKQKEFILKLYAPKESA